MMKKRSIIILLLSALLCLSMLLTSCNSAANDGHEETTEAETDAPEVTDAVVDHASIMKKWGEYLTFTAPDEKEPTFEEISHVFSDRDSETKNVTASLEGWFYVVETAHLTLVPAPDPALPDEEIFDETVEKYSYEVYNVCTGALVLREDLQYGEVSGYFPTCEISSVQCDGTYLQIIEVKKEAYELVTDELGNETVVPVQSYSYYDASGSAIAVSETPVEASVNDGGNITLELNEKIYTFSYDGALLYVFEKKTERIIPYGTETYGDYLYIFGDDGVIVLDEQYKLLCKYTESRDYDYFDRYLIADGSRIVYQYKSRIGAKKTTYDYEDFGGTRYVMDQLIVDVKSGTVTETARDFEIVKMISSLDRGSTGIGFKDAYQLAVIRKITDAVLSNEYVFAVLDNDLNVVAELPSFIKAQKDVVGMLDGDKLLISSETYDGSQSLYYTVSVSDCSVVLYIDDSDDRYERIDNGFIYGETLYNNNCEELLDLGDYDSYRKFDDFLLLQGEETYLCYIGNGELFKKLIATGDDTVAVREGYVITEEHFDDGSFEYGKIYNNAGSFLFGSDSVIVYDGLPNGEGYAWIKCIVDVDDGSEAYYILK